MDPFTPIFLLLLGALATLMGRSRSFRVTGVTALAAAFFAGVVTLLLGFRLPAAVALSRWRTELYFGDSLRLAADGASWLIALALLLGLLGACLAGLLGRIEQGSRHQATSLLVIACALGAVFADNLMTLAIAWVCLDLVVYFSRVFLLGDNRATAEFTVSLLAVALMIAAGLLGAEAGETAVLSGGKLRGHGVLFLVVAVILRLGLYPVHVGARRVVDSPHVDIEIVTRWAAFAVAVDLLAVLALQPPILLVRGGLTVLALVAGLVGGWRWYSANMPREHLTHMLLAQGGVIMLIFLWGGQWALAGVVAQGISVLLAGPVLSLYRGNVGFGRIWTLNPVLATLVLGGLPLTVGFVGALTLYSGFLQAGTWVLVLPIVIVIEALLMAGGFWLANFPGPVVPTQVPFANAGYQLGLTLPVAAGVLAGIAPDRLGAIVGVAGLPGWAGMLTPNGFTALGSTLVAGGIGGGLWAFKEQFQARGISIPRLTLVSILELRWLHSGVWNLCRALARVMRAAALVLEGHGGVLWALVLVTIVWLALGA